MPPLNILIKPASSLCNMNCQYCFYRDEAVHRETYSYGIMTYETLEQTIKRIFEFADTECSIAWQGGEPTLVGIPFFEEYIAIEKKYNIHNIPVHRFLQTNGYQLNDDWAAFFSKHHFLVGVSLDGIDWTHNMLRKSKEGKDTFASIYKTLKVLDQHHVDYNILTVVNRIVAENIHQIYKFYHENSFNYQQYIACLEPMGEKPGQQSWSLTPEQYGNFLIELFKLWYQDSLRGNAPYIRQFENYIGILLGVPPESCEQRGICTFNPVVEADGSVYPCDFFVLDDYKMGNLMSDSLTSIYRNPKVRQFSDRSEILPQECWSCMYLQLCRGGCFRHRYQKQASVVKNLFCKSYKMFFDECLNQIKDLAIKFSQN